MASEPLGQRIQPSLRRWANALRKHGWFPHVPLAVLVAGGALKLLHLDVGRDWQRYLALVMEGQFDQHAAVLPPLLIGLGQLTMSAGLLMRSRVGWTMTVLMTIAAIVSLVLGRHQSTPTLIYFSLLLLALLISWRAFDRSSLAASTLFAFTSVVMLVMYATLGSYYLGAEFSPPIKDLVTALYYAMITMTTVGYGDIVPHTPESRLFAVSVVVLGVAVFATSLTAVVTPMINRSLQRIVNQKGRIMKRKDHYVVIGNTSLAINTWRELVKRGQSVTRLLRDAPEEGELTEVDIVVGDSSDVDVLRQAGAHEAKAVLAMRDDDAENAFTVLAVKELAGTARTVAAVNDARHLSRIKLVQPDVIIAPQVLGGELTAMLLTGEKVTADFVLERVFR
ncbi:voltage-gated potassium channel protein [Dyella caseinilytica]|uniref:Voltage-gated potassium channel protein n=1 Tax=Dyella caseinilytica TaxID=1849581 RepID=A0ABX7GS60_9GAMM|nr:voltage-gated potassium channel protein [Dyella caseinilytica]QRN52903.1 voltage-gated potassium channel protein [Dyella caseinilytica]GGA09737.1 voltage-gated potassium channel TrkA [Dyella caseinilytica]